MMARMELLAMLSSLMMKSIMMMARMPWEMLLIVEPCLTILAKTAIDVGGMELPLFAEDNAKATKNIASGLIQVVVVIHVGMDRNITVVIYSISLLNHGKGLYIRRQYYFHEPRCSMLTNLNCINNVSFLCRP